MRSDAHTNATNRNGFIREAVAAGILALAATACVGPSEAGEPKDRFVTTSDGVRIHCLDSGPENGLPALVLVPGWRLTANVWRGQIARFSEERRVIAIDPRSQGASSVTADGNTPEQRGRDLREVIERLKLAQPVLVGWSQGVQDLAAYVQAYGSDSVSGFVLVDSPVSAGPAELDLRRESSKNELSLLDVYAKHPKEYSEGMMHAIFRRPLPAPEFARLVEDSLRTPTSVGVAMLVADLFGIDRRPSLAKFRKPVLVVAAKDSELLETQKEMVRSLPKARLEVVPNTGHAVFVDQTERFDELLRGFLKEITGDTPRKS